MAAAAAGAVGKALGRGFAAAKGINFIFRGQATILWWILEQKPTRPDGLQLSTENLRHNNRFLYDYLQTMRWEESSEFLIDAVGLGAGGLARAGGPFPAGILATIGARAWASNILGSPTEKTFLGIFPSTAAFPTVEAFDAAFSIAQGGLALVTEGIGIGGGIAGAVASGDFVSGFRAVAKIPGFIQKSLEFLSETGSTLADLEKGFRQAGIVFAIQAETIARDIAHVAQYYGNIILGIFRGSPGPSKFEKFIFRTPAEILRSLMGPVTDVGSRFVPGDVRPPTKAEILTGPAREKVRQARERVSRKQAEAIPTRLTIEDAKEISRIGVEFQQEQFQMGLGMIGRSRGTSDTGLLELLREVKGKKDDGAAFPSPRPLSGLFDVVPLVPVDPKIQIQQEFRYHTPYI